MLLPLSFESHSDELHDDQVLSQQRVDHCGLDHPASFETAEQIEISECLGCLQQLTSGSDLCLSGSSSIDWVEEFTPKDESSDSLATREFSDPSRGPPGEPIFS